MSMSLTMWIYMSCHGICAFIVSTVHLGCVQESPLIDREITAVDWGFLALHAAPARSAHCPNVGKGLLGVLSMIEVKREPFYVENTCLRAPKYAGAGPKSPRVHLSLCGNCGGKKYVRLITSPLFSVRAG